jgi:Ca2+-binding EF-hand superfamily protein
LTKAIESRGDSISKSELKTVFFNMDANKDGKISQDEMLQSKIAMQYQDGTLGELPAIKK